MRWALVSILASAAIAAALVLALHARADHAAAVASSASSSGQASIGGPFQLVDQNGQPVSDKDMLGKPTVMFFGFTYCPDVCPTTLAQITNWLDVMGPDADKLNVVFVTIDPERDTSAQLKTYLSSFDKRIRGLTGPPAAIAQMAKEYRVYVHKEPLPGGGYTMDHSATIYLFDRKGRFVSPLVYTQPSATAVATLEQLVKGT